jgi:5-methylcytosine-specific restriction endonuclease McrA
MGIPVPKPQHVRRIPKQKFRNEFHRSCRQMIYERDNGMCRNCGTPGQEIHHVRFRSQGGRGVYENGLLLCHSCHEMMHKDYDRARTWQTIFEHEYGSDYFRDQWDL